jgi:hypothetical protein
MTDGNAGFRTIVLNMSEHSRNLGVLSGGATNTNFVIGVLHHLDFTK